MVLIRLELLLNYFVSPIMNIRGNNNNRLECFNQTFVYAMTKLYISFQYIISIALFVYLFVRLFGISWKYKSSTIE